MSGPERDGLKQEAGKLLAEYQDAELSWAELRESIGGLADVGRTDRLALATIWNLAMVAVGVGVALLVEPSLARAGGVAWAVFNGYPLVAAVWRWLT